MTKKEPTEAEVIALFAGYWSHLSAEVLDGYRREFEQRGWSDALDALLAGSLAKTATRQQALIDAVTACRNQKIENPDNNADDETYNRAIDHCIETILGVA
jgi:hypothetical protein